MATEKIIKQAKKLGAVMRGHTGILGTLEGEHAEIANLMEKVIDTEDVERRTELFRTIRIKLLAHSQAEAAEFYPVCREYPETEGLIAEAFADHDQIERELFELQNLPVDSAAWLEGFVALRRDVQRHVAVEENELIERCKDVMARERLRALDRNFTARRELIEENLERESAERPTTYTEPRPPM